MRLAFLGTPDFSVPTLAALVEAGHEIACVYAQPAAPRGRGQALRPSPVQAFAEAARIPVRTPASMRDPAEIAAFAALGLDAAVVVAFGQILPEAVLEAPRLGSYNLHASLLPRWRGAAPIQRAIMAGDAVTGAEVMRMTAGLDEGPVIASMRLRIDALETAGTLHDRLAAAGARLMVEAIGRVGRGEAVGLPQPEDGATYAKKIRPSETRIRWDRTASRV
ncbi:MAG: methionyl-tRNA formyltransferase, partial [Caulobacteraceae bacterium]|nr:methionyl-tRNA formyltransferase [Caulobacteraceae bacterium]